MSDRQGIGISSLMQYGQYFCHEKCCDKAKAWIEGSKIWEQEQVNRRLLVSNTSINNSLTPAEYERFLFVYALKSDIRDATSFDDLTIYQSFFETNNILESQKPYINLSRQQCMYGFNRRCVLHLSETKLYCG